MTGKVNNLNVASAAPLQYLLICPRAPNAIAPKPMGSALFDHVDMFDDVIVGWMESSR